MSRKSKAEWIAFFVEFEASGLSLGDFCEQKQVPYQSAKNWSSQLKKAKEYPVKGRAGTGTGTKKNTGTGKGFRKGTGTGTAKAGKAGAKKVSEQSKKRTEKSTAETPDPKPISGEKNMSFLDNLKSYKPGEHRAGSVMHGAYTRFLPPDVSEAVAMHGRDDLRSVIEEIRLTRGRLIIVGRNRAAWDAKVEYNELTDSDYILDLIEDGPFGRKETRKRPDFEGHEDRLSRRLAWLMQVQEQLSKRASFTADEAISKRREIMEMGAEKGWTYTQIGLEIEKYGIELPFTLQALIKQELDQPVIESEDTGFSDEDLEMLSQQYAEEAELDDQWLAGRKADVAQIHSVTDAKKVSS